MFKKFKYTPKVADKMIKPGVFGYGMFSVSELLMAYQESGFPAEEIALEFYNAACELSEGKSLRDLDLEHIEFDM